MTKRTIRASVCENLNVPTRDSKGRILARPFTAQDAMLSAQNSGRPLDPGALWSGEVGGAARQLRQSVESVRKALTAAVPLNSPLNAGRELSAEGAGRALEPGKVWAGLARVEAAVNDMLSEIQQAPEQDALEAEPAFDTLRRMNDRARALWTPDAATRVTDTRSAARDAHAATDMRTRIAAMNRAAAAFWRGNESAE